MNAIRRQNNKVSTSLKFDARSIPGLNQAVKNCFIHYKSYTRRWNYFCAICHKSSKKPFHALLSQDLPKAIHSTTILFTYSTHSNTVFYFLLYYCCLLQPAFNYLHKTHAQIPLDRKNSTFSTYGKST